ncbi:uncharacterized protein LOC143881164 [Tasmannia lanceolata]|uniref:uncharacterized protein LOC143881164 n=1 Tax=Tasmannia lanceolata TaxID=3420 RepID=UPI004063A9A2
MPILDSPRNTNIRNYVKALGWSSMTESECQLGRFESEIFPANSNSSASCSGRSPEEFHPTLSPIFSSISCSSPSNELGPINQNSCIVTNDGKKSASAKQEEETHKTKSKGKSTIGGQFGLEDEKHSLPLVSSESKDNQLILVAVNTEQDERGCNKNHNGRSDDPQSHGSTSLQVSEGYMGRNLSRHEDSDLESSINEHQRSGTPTSFVEFMSEVKKNEIEAKNTEWKAAKALKLAKITAWKASKALKLTNKLGSKASEISDWELRQIYKARTDMKDFEIKMEEKHMLWQRKMEENREKALAKMEQRINEVRRKAEEKKVKKRNEALKKIFQLSQFAEKMGATGKRPVFLMILWKMKG